MLTVMERALGSISWRAKILTLSGFFILVILAVGISGALTIFEQNHKLEYDVAIAEARMQRAIEGGNAVIQAGDALQLAALAAGTPDVRRQAIGAIRALSTVDEAVQRMEESLAGDPTLEELKVLLDRVRPAQMEVIKAARKGDAEGARAKLAALRGELDRINALARQLAAQETERLAAMRSQLIEEGRRAIVTGAVVAAVGIAIGILVSLVASSLMTKPLTRVEQAMRALADGDLRVELQAMGKDESARMVEAICRMVSRLREAIGQLQEGAGQLNAQARDVDQAAERISDISSRLYDTVSHLKGEADQVTEISTQVTGQLDATANEAQESADVVAQTADRILAAVENFKRFQQGMEETAQVTRELVGAAEAITSITATIRDISGQTNLLALNAAIEAARAGEQGRGFAVVADEVRGLAERADQATNEIAELIETISSKVGATAKMLDNTVEESRQNIDGLREVAEEVGDTSERARAIRASMQELVAVMNGQEQAIGAIIAAVNDFYGLTEETREQTERLNALSGTMNQAAAALNQTAERFHL